MKRKSAALVDYAGSDDNSSDSSSDEKPHTRKKTRASSTHEPSSSTSPPFATQPTSRPRKLPYLAPSITGPVHVDNPALHQGRIRSVPHVDGQWACHVYVPVTLKPRSALRDVLEDAIQRAKTSGMSAFHTFWDAETPRPELHISLSRPIFLRAHQREDLKRAVKRVARETQGFSTSFTSFSVLTNDENTRAFLTVDVGAGHPELAAMTSKLTPFLRSVRQQEYYSCPKYHASIGWTLLSPKYATSTSAVDGENDATVSANAAETSAIPATSIDTTFASIPAFPEGVVDGLNKTYGSRIVKVGLVEVGRVSVRIGKEVSSWALGS
uniref:U6 snRNA phosphodiesterase n=1 Tax=Schizophyllum commune (strain H4-8 / FGSC 9210) TaxID=578458 RepID=D8PZL2_SCHCM